MISIYIGLVNKLERLQQVSKDIPSKFGNANYYGTNFRVWRIYQYTIRPKIGYEHRYNAVQLRTIKDWVVRRQLLGTEEVADVASFGGFKTIQLPLIHSTKIDGRYDE